MSSVYQPVSCRVIRLLFSKQQYLRMVEAARRRGCSAERWAQEILDNALADAKAKSLVMDADHYTMRHDPNTDEVMA